MECESYSELEFHHIIPISAGGSDEFNNVIVLCHDCHRKRENGLHVDWMLHYDKLHEWKSVIDKNIIDDAFIRKHFALQD